MSQWNAPTTFLFTQKKKNNIRNFSEILKYDKIQLYTLELVTGEMVQLLRTLAAKAEDPGSIP